MINVDFSQQDIQAIAHLRYTSYVHNMTFIKCLEF